MQVTIRSTGYVRAVSVLRALGEAGRAVSGPFANWGSRLPYAGVIETGNAELKRDRCPNSAAKATLLFSKTVSQPVWPTITPCPIRCVSGRNSMKRTIGTAS